MTEDLAANQTQKAQHQSEAEHTASDTNPATSQLQASSLGGEESKQDVFSTDNPIQTERDMDKTASFDHEVEDDDQNEAPQEEEDPLAGIEINDQAGKPAEYEYYDEEEPEQEYDQEEEAEAEVEEQPKGSQDGTPDKTSETNGIEQSPNFGAQEDLQHVIDNQEALNSTLQENLNLAAQTNSNQDKIQTLTSKELNSPSSNKGTGRETADILKSGQHKRAAAATNQKVMPPAILTSQEMSGHGNPSLQLKKQAHSANINMISYQTANFGKDEDPTLVHNSQILLEHEEGHSTNSAISGGNPSAKQGKSKKELSIMSSQEEQKQMFTSMSDIGVAINKQNRQEKPQNLKVNSQIQGKSLLTPQIMQTLQDSKANWKIRTETIDQLHEALQKNIESQADKVLSETEKLLDLCMHLLGDQNFKIVLTSLAIINLSLTYWLQEVHGKKDQPNEGAESLDGLSLQVPMLIKKLSDSKNIIRQQAVKGLVSVFCIMRAQNAASGGKSATNINRSSRTLLGANAQAIVGGPISPKNAQTPSIMKSSNNFVQLTLPYLNNSASWHVREELLNVLIHCFLKSKNFFEFDSYAILEGLLKSLDDSKERNRFIALEAIVAFSSIGNKFSTKEIIYQLAEKQISELVGERLEAAADMNPFLNQQGQLELPYLDHIEQATSQIGRENLKSEPATPGVNPQTQVSGGKRGSSSRKNMTVPGSANSLQNAANQGQQKRTASANNRLQAETPPVHHQVSRAESFLLEQQQRMAQANNMMIPQFNPQQTAQSEYTRYYQQQQQLGQSRGQGTFHSSHQQPMANAIRHNFRLSSDKAASAAASEFNHQQNDSFLPELTNKKQQSQSKSIQGVRVPSLHASGSRGGSQAAQFQPQQATTQHNSSMYSTGANRPPALDINPMLDPGQHNAYEQLFVESMGGNFSPNNNSSMLQNWGPSSEQRQPNQRKPSAGSINQYNMSNYSGGIHQQMSAAHAPHHQVNLSRGSMIASADSSMAQGLDNTQPWLGFDPASDASFLASQAGMFSAGNPASGQSRRGPQQFVPGQPTYPDQLHLQQQMTQYSQNGSQAGRFQAAQDTSQSFSRKFSGASSQQAVPHHIHNSAATQGKVMNWVGSNYDQSQMGPHDIQMQFTPQNVGGRQALNSQQKLPKQIAASTTYSEGSMMTHTTTTTGTTGVAVNRKRKGLVAAKQMPTGPQTINNFNNSELSVQNPVIDLKRPQIIQGQKGPIKATQKINLRNSHAQNSDSQTNVFNVKPVDQPTSGKNNSNLIQSTQNSKTELVVDSRKVNQDSQKDIKTQNGQDSKPNLAIGLGLSQQQSEAEEQAAAFGGRNMKVQADGRPLAGAKPEERQLNNNKFKQFGYEPPKVGDLDLAAQETAEDMMRPFDNKDDLQPLQKDQSKQFKKALNQLQVSDDWEVQFDSCNLVRRVCKWHQDLILQHGSTLHSLVKQLIKHADSLRSQVARIALLTISDMFTFLKRCMETYLDPLIKILLKRGAENSNQFIQEEADLALVNMIENCNDSKVLQTLLVQNINSRANTYRLRLCRCFEQLVICLGNNILFFKDADKLISQLAKYIGDAWQDVRNCAKRAFVHMSQAIMGKNDLERLLQRVLNENQYKKVRSYLDSEPANYDYQQSQANFVITNVNNNGSQGNKKSLKPQGKGTLRTGFLNQQRQSNSDLHAEGRSLAGSGMDVRGDELNIQATQIVNPKQRIKQIQLRAAASSKQSQQNFEGGELSISGSGSSQEEIFTELVTKALQNIFSTQHDWRARHESMESFFNLIHQYADTKFSQSTPGNSKLSEVADALCKLLGDSNLKIQSASLNRFKDLILTIKPFIEAYLLQFFQVLASNLMSTNSSVRRVTDQILEKMYKSLQTSAFVTPICSQIAHQQNSRLKPILIEHLQEYLVENCSVPQLQKQVLPLAYKLLDDNRTEVKQKTEKLLRKLYLVLGQQVIDSCPQSKLQKVCETLQNISAKSSGSNFMIMSKPTVKGVQHSH